MDKSKLIEELKKDPDITAAILFGSYATGHFDGDSDVDVALLFNRGKETSLLERLDMQQTLSDVIHKDVDLISLNEASPILAMQVTKYGTPLFIRNQRLYDEYEMKLITDYADVKKMREPFENDILKRKLHD